MSQQHSPMDGGFGLPLALDDTDLDEEQVAPAPPAGLAPTGTTPAGHGVQPGLAPTGRAVPPVAPVGAAPLGVAPAPVPAAPAPAAAAARPGAAPPPEPAATLVLDDLLRHVLDVGASDLHLTAGIAPSVRVRGDMTPIEGYSVLVPEQLRIALYGVMTQRQRMVFEEELELDFAYTLPGRARFRVNMFWQREAPGAVLRLIPWEIASLDALGMPKVISGFAALKRGLVLVTGPTGSGKSTTLAALVDQINRTRRGHIVTIEDPIEFIHEHRGCVVNQREVGRDTKSFRAALKHVLRQDPDVILVGELRDLETISVALSAAETGHLVLATLHTQSAQDTVTRVVDVFPADQQQQIKAQLAAAIQGVVCQTLARTVDGKGRAAAVEIMVATPAIRAMIRDGKLQQIQGALQSGAREGMQTMNKHLAELVRAGRITFEAGLDLCTDKADFRTLAGSAAR